MLIHHYLVRGFKYVFILALALFFSISLFSQTTVQGKVTDSKDGSPVVGASVVAQGQLN